MEGLASQFGGMLSIERPAGGMQLIAGLPDGMSDTAIVRTMADRGILARAVSGFYLSKAKSQGLLQSGHPANWQNENKGIGASYVKYRAAR